MIEHTTLPCSNASKSRAFFEKALLPLNYRVTKEYGDSFGFSQYGRTDFWISKRRVGAPTHVAFTADDRKQVHAFYEAAIAAGGKDNGPPGPREGYGYAAFVFDPDGHNIEAVYFGGKWKNPFAPKRRPAAKKKNTPARKRR